MHQIVNVHKVEPDHPDLVVVLEQFCKSTHYAPIRSRRIVAEIIKESKFSMIPQLIRYRHDNVRFDQFKVCRRW